MLEYMQQGGRITALSALNMFGCLRLSGRIFDLRAQGYPVLDKWVTTSTKKRVKEYYMNISSGSIDNSI